MLYEVITAWLVLGKGLETLFDEEYLPAEIAQKMQQQAEQEVAAR